MPCNLRRVVGSCVTYVESSKYTGFSLRERERKRCVGRGSALSHQEAVNYAKMSYEALFALLCTLSLALSAQDLSRPPPHQHIKCVCPAFCTRLHHASHGIRPGLGESSRWRTCKPMTCTVITERDIFVLFSRGRTCMMAQR
ncbi:hypothetical protein IG631_21406 [Alternaria alternata]|nr:hypothetical protein IG631_21406 [Alternaria alternata]